MILKRMVMCKSRLLYREMDAHCSGHSPPPSALESQSRANQGSVVANRICKCRCHKAGHLQVRVAVGRRSTCVLVLKEAPWDKGSLGFPQFWRGQCFQNSKWYEKWHETCRYAAKTPLFTSEKNSLNIKFLGGIFLGHPGPRRRDIPDKNFMQVAFFCCFRQGVAGMSRVLGRDVPDVENFMQENFGLIFHTLSFSWNSKEGLSKRGLGLKTCHNELEKGTEESGPSQCRLRIQNLGGCHNYIVNFRPEVML